MEENQRLSERLQEVSGSVGPEHLAWNQFVRDHKNYIKKQCDVVQVEPEQMVKYRYRPIEFAVSKGCLPEHTWIFLYINDLRDPAEFNESRDKFYMFIPDIIKELYRKYSSSANAVSV